MLQDISIYLEDFVFSCCYFITRFQNERFFENHESHRAGGGATGLLVLITFLILKKGTISSRIKIVINSTSCWILKESLLLLILQFQVPMCTYYNKIKD